MAQEDNVKNPPAGGEELNEIEELKKKSDEYLNGWKRERADFINYKREEIERVGFLGKCVKEDMILKILPILDNIYLAARQNLPSENLDGQESAGVKSFFEGLDQIKKQFENFLAKEGVEEIKTIGDPPSHEASEGQRKFDPSLMEVIEEVKIEGQEPGIVVEEIQKGYTMDGKVIRPAKVKISK